MQSHLLFDIRLRSHYDYAFYALIFNVTFLEIYLKKMDNNIDLLLHIFARSDRLGLSEQFIF
jgi:hypothetical protein